MTPSTSQKGTPLAPGFTLIEVMIVVAIIGILLAIAIPGFIRARTISQARACQENLRLIDESKETLALAEGLECGATVTWADLYDPSDRMKCYLDRGIPVCPGGGSYILKPISDFPECTLGAEDLLGGSPAAQHRIAQPGSSATVPNSNN